MHEAGRYAVRVVSITPYLSTCLRRVGQINFVSILPLIIKDYRSFTRHHHGIRRVDRRAEVGFNRAVSLQDLGFRHGQVKIVDDLRSRRRTQD